jgi:hypothetical protein
MSSGEPVFGRMLRCNGHVFMAITRGAGEWYHCFQVDTPFFFHATIPSIAFARGAAGFPSTTGWDVAVWID